VKNVLRAANKNAILSGIGGTKGAANASDDIADGWTVTENGSMRPSYSLIASAVWAAMALWATISGS
jgi:hypothetical protein